MKIKFTKDYQGTLTKGPFGEVFYKEDDEAEFSAAVAKAIIKEGAAVEVKKTPSKTTKGTAKKGG